MRVVAGGLDAHRAVQTVADDAAGVRWFGSGYLVAPDLVLTAQHVLRGSAAPQVRFVDGPGRVREVATEVVFANAVADVAVLRLACAEPDAAPVVFGYLAGPEACEALAFPRYKLNDDHRAERTAGRDPSDRSQYRDCEHVSGTCSPDSNRRAGTLSLAVPAPGPDPDPDASPWEGVSGAAVFAGGLLIGVVTEHPRREGLGRLTGRAVRQWAHLLDAPSWRRLQDLLAVPEPDRLATAGLPASGPMVRGLPPAARCGDEDDDDDEDESDEAEPLRGYLDATRKAVEEHPYPGIPGLPDPPPLAEVYVRQHTIPAYQEGGLTPVRDGEAGADGGTGTAAPVPAETVFQAADPISVLVAGPGIGKSTLLRTRLRQAADAWFRGAGHAEEPNPTVAVWISARALIAKDTPVPEALANATRNLSQYGRRPELSHDRFLRAPCTNGRWQLLVDGLDELPNARERRTVLKKLANAVRQEPPLYQCIIATRPLPGGELGDLGPLVPLYHLQPFTTDDLHVYTQRYFASRWPLEDAARHARQFVAALRAGSLIELSRTPLMAFMLCQLYLADPERAQPKGRSAVYEAFTELIYETNEHKQIAASHEEAIKQLVSACQTYSLREEVAAAARKVYERLPELIDYLAHRRLTGDQAPADQVLASHEAVCRPSKVKNEVWQAFLKDLLHHTGLLVHQVDGLGFPHQTFIEYHAARHATRNREAREKLIDELFPPGRMPQLSTAEQSYLGFLLDSLLNSPELDITAETARRIESYICQYGEDALDFLVAQVGLRTSLPTAPTAGHLTRWAADATLDDYKRAWAAEALTLVDGYQQQGAELLIALAKDNSFSDYDRVWAAEHVTRVEGHQEAGVELLCDLAKDSLLHNFERLDAAKHVTRMDGYQHVAVELLADLAKDSTLSDPDRVWAAEHVTRMDGYQHVAVELLADLAKDSTLHDSQRLNAAEHVTRTDGYQQMGVELLFTLASDATRHRHERVRASQALARIDGYRELGPMALANDTTVHGSC